MANPFDNPWSNNKPNEPRYGNAYEVDNSAFNMNNNAYHNEYALDTNQQMPVASEYNNAWVHNPQRPINLSDRTTEGLPQPQNAYQYSGTRYGNQQNIPPAGYSKAPTGPVESSHSSRGIPPDGPDLGNGRTHRSPGQSILWFRFVILLASIGHLGFAAGARPYSGENIPFSTPACFYYLYAVACISIIYTIYHLFNFCYRHISKNSRQNRYIIFGLDLLMAFMWGIGVIIEVSKYRCPNSGKFCAFYNVSIFWGFLSFALYIVALFGDIIGACSRK